MTAIQIGALNAEILHNLGVIAENESVLNRVAKYLRRVAKEVTKDSTLMTKEEYFHMLDEAEKGPSKRFANIEELDKYINSL
ncbi:MAG: hypothetical protein IJT97_10430 [Bacteroidaceae bacterium]|nr:hypothetical protein [Bacteroidaceae bacterium]